MVTKQPVLIMIQGPEPGSVYKLPDNRVTTIGRSSRNTICTVSASVSRFHCEVSWVNGFWELNDLNSKRGTLANGQPITERWELAAGDIIRASSTVFRFDMIDENALKDGAIVAIMEAGLDQKLDTKRGGVGSLDDIRVRSRLEVEHAREGRRPGDRAPRVNVAFLATMAAATAIIAGGLLRHAHRQTKAPGRLAAERGQEAQAAHDEALADLDAGRHREAMSKLRRVAQDFADTDFGSVAAAAAAQTIWAAADQALSAAGEAEKSGDITAALQAYDEVGQYDPPVILSEFIDRRRAYTVRLAHAHFKHVDQAAQRRLQQGDPDGALRLYREARRRIGLPELQEQADRKIDQIRQ